MTTIMNRRRAGLSCATSALALTVFAGAAFAQTGALEEIVVSARKTEENLMTVPLAITAITAGDMEAHGIKQMTDVSLFSPSFHFQNETGGGSGRNDRSIRQMTFRGLSVA